jgi:aspartyl-tRNA(Asn)/glutamyl-tRNA(Gln) amidotransferase subunit A
MDDLCKLDARTISSGVAAGELSACEIVSASISRIRELDDVLHAFFTVAEDSAYEHARDIDRRVKEGQDLGSLAGVPVGVKDVLFTKGIPTTGGCLAYSDFVPDADDPVVSRLVAADAIVVGKTATSELAYGPSQSALFPQAANPWDISLSPGNSSSGSAAAVAAGLVPVALGTDGGGSIRCPASFCGVFGIKPSRGRVPSFRDARYPGLSSWRSLGHTGPITRTVADAALVMSAISGPDPRDGASLPEADLPWLDVSAPAGLEGIRIGYSVNWGYATVDEAVEVYFEAAIEVLQTLLGATLVEARPAWADLGPVMDPLIAADSDLAAMRKMQADKQCFRSPSILTLLSREWSAEDLTSAMAARDQLCVEMARLMQDLDFLVTPTVATTPFPLEDLGPKNEAGTLREISDWCPFTQIANITGQPASSVPVGWTGPGLPVGMQIVGRKFDDLGVLRVSAAFEEAARWADRWPPVEQHNNCRGRGSEVRTM